MAITFENTPLEWNNAGAQPSTDLKANGFAPGYKPAADTFNYQINNSSACLTELQTKLSGLDSSMIKGIRGKGTLITPMSDQTVNITAASVGAAASSHNHSADNITSGTLPIERGGTGATTASGAKTNLGFSTSTILYSNNSGTGSTITLSDSASNYDYIEFYYFKDLNQIVSSKIYNPNGKAATLGSVTFYANSIFLRAAIVDISETTLTWRAKDIGWGTVAVGGNTISKEQVFKICQVIGYK